MNKLRVSIKSTTGQRLTNSEIAATLIKRLFREDIVSDDHLKAVKRMQRAEKQKSKQKSKGTAE